MSARCVLLHGFAGSPQSWDEVVALLPSEWRLARPAIAGHAPTAEWPAGVESFDREVERLGTAIAPLERPLLCGYSLGGRLALGLLRRNPERFAAALLVGAHPGLPGGPAGRDARRERGDADERWARLIEDDLGAFVAAWERLPLFASQRRLPAAVLERQRAVRTAHRPELLARAMRVLSLGGMPDHRSTVAELAVPTVWMAGALDHKFAALAEEMAASTTAGRARLVPAVGHNVPLEAPAAVAEALRELAEETG